MDRDINAIIPVGPLPVSPPGARAAGPREPGTAFREALQKELERGQVLKFSAHAERRLRERNIVLAGEDLVKIDKAVRLAEARGARESLIIYGDLAIITSIKNKTVVTALEGRSAQDHVFTNIDSAVIVK